MSTKLKIKKYKKIPRAVSTFKPFKIGWNIKHAHAGENMHMVNTFPFWKWFASNSCSSSKPHVVQVEYGLWILTYDDPNIPDFNGFPETRLYSRVDNFPLTLSY